MYQYKYKMPGVNSTVVAYSNGKVLLGLRSSDSDAYPDCYCLPGGFLETDQETTMQCAARELEEESSVTIDPENFMLFDVSSHPDTDPRLHVVNICYAVEIPKEKVGFIKANDDLQKCVLVDFDEALSFELAFDHGKILRNGLSFLKEKVMDGKIDAGVRTRVLLNKCDLEDYETVSYPTP